MIITVNIKYNYGDTHTEKPLYQVTNGFAVMSVSEVELTTIEDFVENGDGNS